MKKSLKFKIKPMNNDISTAKTILSENNYTCVLYFNKKEFHSTERGVKPLLDFLKSDYNFKDFCAADKVIGAGAAHLYVLLGIKTVWAKTISKEAQKIFKNNEITFFFEEEVPYIINRSGDGVCPIEKAVIGITDSDKALTVITKTLKSLTKRL